MANTAFEIPGLRFGGNAAGAIPRRRFVKVTSTGTLDVASAGGAAAFVSMTEATKAEEVLDAARGIVIVEASDVIVAGTQVEVAAGGKAATKASGIAVGLAMTSASADKELISVLMIG